MLAVIFENRKSPIHPLERDEGALRVTTLVDGPNRIRPSTLFIFENFKWRTSFRLLPELSSPIQFLVAAHSRITGPFLISIKFVGFIIRFAQND